MEPQVEWEKAREAAAKLESLLSGEVAYLIEGNKIKNVYSPVAWVRMCRMLHTLTYGMAVMRMVYEGKTNAEITKATGLPATVIAAYKAWNTMYSDKVEAMLAARGKTEKARKRDLEFLASIGVSLREDDRGGLMDSESNCLGYDGGEGDHV